MKYSRLFWIYLTKHGEKTVDSLIKIFVNKIESRITFKINTGYYVEILTPETMKLVKSLKVK